MPVCTRAGNDAHVIVATREDLGVALIVVPIALLLTSLLVWFPLSLKGSKDVEVFPISSGLLHAERLNDIKDAHMIPSFLGGGTLSGDE